MTYDITLTYSLDLNGHTKPGGFIRECLRGVILHSTSYGAAFIVFTHMNSIPVMCSLGVMFWVSQGKSIRLTAEKLDLEEKRDSDECWDWLMVFGNSRTDCNLTKQ